MQTLLGDNFVRFVAECESLGLVERFEALQRLDIGNSQTTCAFCGSALVSAANELGAKEDFDRALMLAEWAIQLEPSHMPALETIAIAHHFKGQEQELLETQERIASLHARLVTTPEHLLTRYERGVIEALGKR
ncbi:MAG TPA: hypothetical protein PK093_09905 [Phycisphaerae bacterium]|nr:hypothetical protein [Phycisphaerae bacterium]